MKNIIRLHGKEDISFITEQQKEIVKLAKQNRLKKMEVLYSDVFINKIKQILPPGTRGNDKQIFELFIKTLTNDK